MSELPKQGWMDWDEDGNILIRKVPTKLTEKPQMEVQGELGLTIPGDLDPNQSRLDIQGDEKQDKAGCP